MECSQYHFKQAARLLHWCLWWHWVGARSVQFLIGCNPLFWINGGFTQVSCSFCFFPFIFIVLSLVAEIESSLGLMSLALISFSGEQSATLLMCNSVDRYLNPEQKTKPQKLEIWRKIWRKIMSCFSTAFWSAFVLSFTFGYQFYESSHNCFVQKLTA